MKIVTSYSDLQTLGIPCGCGFSASKPTELGRKARKEAQWPQSI